MITVKEADKIIFDNINEFSSVRIPLQEAYGMVLREDLIADRDLPPSHRATMDGIAINFSSWESGNSIFPIEGIQKAGDPSLTLKDSSSCTEIMTGAVVPAGCDCVIPVEDIEISNSKAKVNGVELTRMMNVHAQGSDHKNGSKLVLKGARLYPSQVAIAASIGKKEVLVSLRPKIAVIGTGDELIAIDQKPQVFQIRQSNSYALQAALQLSGYDQVKRFHIKDDKDELRTQLGQLLKSFDVIILSGGVSMGKFDYVPEVLKEIGVEMLFHKVQQRPGKPFWFGKNKEGKPVFALPGNPVSTQVGVVRYILPYLDKALGVTKISPELAALGEDVKITNTFTNFLPVKIESREDGRLLATPVIPNSSGDFASLVQSDGFLELPPDNPLFPKGAVARFYRWNS